MSIENPLWGAPRIHGELLNLLMAGAQGMQLALLAPGWLHGCLGLWITLRRFNAMQRIKYLLVVLVVFIPLFRLSGGHVRFRNQACTHFALRGTQDCDHYRSKRSGTPVLSG
jgi:adenylate cyclase